MHRDMIQFIYTYISIFSDSLPHRSSLNIEPFILNMCVVWKVLVFYFISVSINPGLPWWLSIKNAEAGGDSGSIFGARFP